MSNTFLTLDNIEKILPLLDQKNTRIQISFGINGVGGILKVKDGKIVDRNRFDKLKNTQMHMNIRVEKLMDYSTPEPVRIGTTEDPYAGSGKYKGD